MEKDEINKKVEMLRERFIAERASYVDGRCKLCDRSIDPTPWKLKW